MGYNLDRSFPKPDKITSGKRPKKIKLPPLTNEPNRKNTSLSISTIAHLNLMAKRKPHQIKYGKGSKSKKNKRISVSQMGNMSSQSDMIPSSHASSIMAVKNIQFPETTGGLLPLGHQEEHDSDDDDESVMTSQNNTISTSKLLANRNDSTSNPQTVDKPAPDQGHYIKASSKVAASLLDDIKLKKHLNMAFNAETDSFLSQVQLASEYGMVPDTKIPKEYWLYANSPLQQGFTQHHYMDKISFDATSNSWNKLIFPTNQPTRRVEIYLLARTLDDMLKKLKNSYNLSKTSDMDDLQMEYVAKSFAIHLTAMNEIVRQIFTECAERGIMLHKIQGFFKDFYDLTMSVLKSERRKSADYQNLIREYEKLTNDLAVEKQQIRDEMDRLLKDKTYLFKERELLKRKIIARPSNQPKYELIIKLLKNTETRSKILDSLRRTLPREGRDENKALLKGIRSDWESERKNLKIAKITSGSNHNEDGELSPIGVDPSFKHISNDSDPNSDGHSSSDGLSNKKVMELQYEKEKFRRDMFSLHQTLCETVQLLKSISLLNRSVTLMPTAQFDHDEILYTNEPSMNLLNRTLYHANVSLKQIEIHQQRAKEKQDRKNYIHVNFEYPLYNDDKTPYDGKFKVLLLTDEMREKRQVSEDMNDLYSTISKLRRESAAFHKENEKLKSRLADIEEDQEARINEQLNARQATAEMKKGFEDRIEKTTMKMLMMRNRLERNLDDAKNELKDEQQRTKSLIELVFRARRDNSKLETDNDSLKAEIDNIMKRSVTRPVNQRRRSSAATSKSPTTPGDEVKNAALSAEVDKIRKAVEEEAKQELTHVPPLPDQQDAPPKQQIKTIYHFINRHRNVIKNLYSKLRETQELHALSDEDMAAVTNDESIAEILKPFNDSVDAAQFELFPATHNTSLDDEDITIHSAGILKDDVMTKAKLETLREELKNEGKRADKGVQVDTYRVEEQRSGNQNQKDSQQNMQQESSKQENSEANNSATPAADSGVQESTEIKQDEEKKEKTNVDVKLPAVVDETIYEEEEDTGPKLAKNRRLNGIMVAFQKKNVRPKSIIWLLKLITKLYHGKIVLNNDQPLISLPEYVFLYLKKFYGTNALVDEYSGAIMASIAKYETSDLRVALFSKFIREVWDGSVFEPFLVVYELLEQQATVGPDYALPPNGDDEPILAFVSRPRAEATLAAWSVVDPSRENNCDVVQRLLAEKFDVVQASVYSEAMKRAGLPESFDTQHEWHLTTQEARHIVTKAEFFECICKSLLS